MSDGMSGREILLRQRQAGEQFIIDCTMAMRPGWIAAFREAAKDNQLILDALADAELDTPSQITPNQVGS